VIGTIIGNYQVRELLGEGGMGKVYLALHPGIGRRAAIKVLHANLALDPQLVSRFFTEARATNAIQHPSIVDIYDYGTLADSTPYIVMEFLEGRTLKDELAERKPLTVVALDWACQVAEAVAAAHAKQVVHRDLKPENLFVVDDPRVPGHKQIKILDFGIAKLQQDPLAASASSHQTRAGMLMGTPLYMSPEQCLGIKEVDARSDIYSLGVILYEMLTGAPPFVSSAVGSIINMHINQAPEPPTALNPKVTPELETVMLKALEKAPEARYASMYELLGDLQDALGAAGAGDSLDPPWASARIALGGPMSRPISAPGTTLARGVSLERPPAGTTLRTTGRRLRIGLTVTAGALLALSVSFALRGQMRPEPAPTVAAAPRPAGPPAPAVPPAPALVEVALDSEPRGATVRVGQVVVGTTPAVWRTRLSEDPADLEFALDGYRPEHIKALPSQGLRVKAQLQPLPAAKAAAAARPARPRPRAMTRPAVDDIKSER
jgi:hypothetical protein